MNYEIANGFPIKKAEGIVGATKILDEMIRNANDAGIDFSVCNFRISDKSFIEQIVKETGMAGSYKGIEIKFGMPGQHIWSIELTKKSA
jgi:predicted peroxiredoxin